MPALECQVFFKWHLINPCFFFFLSGEVAGFIKWRIVFAILGCFGMAIIYGLKINLSIAIVAMVNQVFDFTNILYAPFCTKVLFPAFSNNS